MNKQIRALIFDVGGVLVRTVDQRGRREWEIRLGLEPGDAERFVLNSKMGKKAQRGEISDEELWAWVGDYLSLGKNLPNFRRDFWRGDEVNQPLVSLIRGLSPKYRMAILSNATDALHTTLTNYGLTQDFDLVVGSAYEGVMKPEPAIFLRTLERLECQPSESVFIDDMLENVEAARSLGLNAIHFVPELDVAAALGNHGVE
jgi:glucose-1-phosphatase